jgi:hypothetical protein
MYIRKTIYVSISDDLHEILEKYFKSEGMLAEVETIMEIRFTDSFMEVEIELK